MKSQSMPMQTIALIIIVLVVLAGVVIFFYIYYSKGKGITGTQTSYSKCKTICMEIQAAVTNGDTQNCQNLVSKWNSNCASYSCKITKDDTVYTGGTLSGIC